MLKKTDVESVFNIFQNSEENKTLIYVSIPTFISVVILLLLILTVHFCFFIYFILYFVLLTDASFIPVKRISAQRAIFECEGCCSSENGQQLMCLRASFLCNSSDVFKLVLNALKCLGPHVHEC